MKTLLVLGLIVVASGVVLSMHHGRPKNDEAEIRQLWERWAKAFQAHDLDGIMSIYAADVVAYDFVPPLQYVGKDAYRKDYEDFLAQFDGPIDVEFPRPESCRERQRRLRLRARTLQRKAEDRPELRPVGKVYQRRP
jgi:uncharacterized protein (TIGR02246 family)